MNLATGAPRAPPPPVESSRAKQCLVSLKMHIGSMIDDGLSGDIKKILLLWKLLELHGFKKYVSSRPTLLHIAKRHFP